MAIGYLLGAARKYDEAIDHLRGLLQLHPNFAGARFMLAEALYFKGLRKEAGAEWFRATESGGLSEDRRTVLRNSYATSGINGVFRTNLALLVQDSKQFRMKPCALVELCAMVGDKDRAFEYLEVAY